MWGCGGVPGGSTILCQGLRLIGLLFHPQNGGVKVVAAISSWRERDRRDGEAKESSSKG